MTDKRSSPIDIENPEERPQLQEEASPQPSIVGSLIDNAMRGAQVATNYLLSFISPPEAKPLGTLHSPIGSSTATSTTRSGTAEHEAHVLAGWRRASPTRDLSPNPIFQLISFLPNIRNLSGWKASFQSAYIIFKSLINGI